MSGGASNSASVHLGFSASYFDARTKFLADAQVQGLALESHPHPEAGRDGEALAMDVALDGPAHAENLLIVSSGCHGVEGYCGSGVQVNALRDAPWRAYARERGVSVLYIHALNPYGFSHLRRVTHENVDLNRNFHDFGAPLPRNDAYRTVHALMLPEQWPPTPQNQAAIAAYLADKGMAALQAAVTGGQYEFADGMFFGGKAPSWSNQTLRAVLRKHGAQAKRIAWIDIHTGLGPNGVGERIFAGPNDPAQIARTRKWWDGGGKTPVTSIYDGSSSSALLSGLMWSSAAQECPQAQPTGIAMEYGTVPMMQVLEALRAEQWLHMHNEAPPALAQQIKRDFLAAFYTDTDLWRSQIVAQAREALFQAVDGLSG